MEFALNIAWALLTLSAMLFWLRTAPVPGQGRRTEFLALAMCLLILFPVISVTDDLQLPANPAETDSCLRRDFTAPDAHSVLPFVAALPEPAFAGLALAAPRLAALGAMPLPALDLPDLRVLQKRPPPTV